MNQFFMRAALLMQANEAAFSWAQNNKQIIITALLSMVPFFEGRYAVTIMVGMGMPAVFSYVLALASSTLPMPFILLLLRPVLDWFYTLPIAPVRKFAQWLENRSLKKREKMQADQSAGLQGKLKGRVSAEMLELIGLYVFVALPLPGTGVWSGSAVATLFKMPRLKAGIAILLGNMTACLIMTLGAYGVVSIF